MWLGVDYMAIIYLIIILFKVVYYIQLALLTFSSNTVTTEIAL